MAVGSWVGTAIGSVVPGIGNAIGLGVGTIVGAGIGILVYAITDVVKINGMSIRDVIKWGNRQIVSSVTDTVEVIGEYLDKGNSQIGKFFGGLF